MYVKKSSSLSGFRSARLFHFFYFPTCFRSKKLCLHLLSEVLVCQGLHGGWHKASMASSSLPGKSSDDCLSGFSVPSCDMAEAEPGDPGQNIFAKKQQKHKTGLS